MGDIIKRGDRKLWTDFHPRHNIIVLFENKLTKLRVRHTTYDEFNFIEGKIID